MFKKIPSGILVICILITIIIYVRFFYVSYTQSVEAESTEISTLFFWIFFLLVITFCVSLAFSFFYYIRHWKENPEKAGRFIAVIITCGLLLSITWLFGDGNPLPLAGYKGSENTYLWLKLTDMWLYSIYTLLSLGFVALVGGIIWSYFKK